MLKVMLGKALQRRCNEWECNLGVFRTSESSYVNHSKPLLAFFQQKRWEKGGKKDLCLPQTYFRYLKLVWAAIVQPFGMTTSLSTEAFRSKTQYLCCHLINACAQKSKLVIIPSIQIYKIKMIKRSHS